MKHIDVTSQIVRHQMLMDLAAMVTKEVHDNPVQEHPDYEIEPVALRPILHTPPK